MGKEFHVIALAARLLPLMLTGKHIINPIIGKYIEDYCSVGITTL
jgi:hypothetical protein